MSAEVGCPNCPFKDLCGRTPEQMKALLQQNYDRNYMDCRRTFPKWKPGLCHKGDIVCAGYVKEPAHG